MTEQTDTKQRLLSMIFSLLMGAMRLGEKVAMANDDIIFSFGPTESYKIEVDRTQKEEPTAGSRLPDIGYSKTADGVYVTGLTTDGRDFLKGHYGVIETTFLPGDRGDKDALKICETAEAGGLLVVSQSPIGSDVWTICVEIYGRDATQKAHGQVVRKSGPEAFEVYHLYNARAQNPLDGFYRAFITLNRNGHIVLFQNNRLIVQIPKATYYDRDSDVFIGFADSRYTGRGTAFHAEWVERKNEFPQSAAELEKQAMRDMIETVAISEADLIGAEAGRVQKVAETPVQDQAAADIVEQGPKLRFSNIAGEAPKRELWLFAIDQNDPHRVYHEVSPTTDATHYVIFAGAKFAFAGYNLDANNIFHLDKPRKSS